MVHVGVAVRVTVAVPEVPEGVSVAVTVEVKPPGVMVHVGVAVRVRVALANGVTVAVILVPTGVKVAVAVYHKVGVVLAVGVTEAAVARVADASKPIANARMKPARVCMFNPPLLPDLAEFVSCRLLDLAPAFGVPGWPLFYHGDFETLFGNLPV